jgi:tetratricopeptide (TPR) repeat protein
MSKQFRYKAFISYSHADERRAAWLHRALENYRIPKSVIAVQQLGANRIGTIFRDREELATSDSLTGSIRSALDASEHLIVICSPTAAQSRWVNEEITYFKNTGRSAQVHCVLVGPPDSSFPPALLIDLNQDGEATTAETEPLAADLRSQGDGKRSAKLKLLSGLLGCGLDELRRRDAQRQQRRMIAAIAASVAGMAITSGLAVWALVAEREADQQRHRAELEATTASQTIDYLVGLFEIADPANRPGKEITARQVLDEGRNTMREHLAEQPRVQARLSRVMSRIYGSLGLYEDSLVLAERAVSLTDQIRDPDELLESKLRLARSLYLANDYEAADELFSELERAPEFNANVELSWSVNTGRGRISRAAAQYDDAERRFKTAFALASDSDTSDPLQKAETLLDLASLERQRGDFEVSLGYVEHNLQILRSTLSPIHPDLAYSQRMLASTLWSLARYEAAAAAAQRAIDIYRSCYDDNHTHYGSAVGMLGLIQLDQGRYDQAEPNLLEANRVVVLNQGADAQYVSVTMQNLGYLYKDMGRPDDAEPWWRGALDIKIATFGPEHVRVAELSELLGEVYLAQGKLEAADELFSRSRTILEQSLGKTHPDLAWPYYGLGLLETARNNHDLAREHLIQAFELQRGLDADDLDRAYPMEALGDLEEAEGNRDRAASWYQKALAIRESKVAANRPIYRLLKTKLEAVLG